MTADPADTRDFPGTAARPAAGTTLSATGSGGPAGRPSGDRYVLGVEIARGGMGEVYAARDIHLGRDVAVKVLQARLAGTAAERRFHGEARVTGRLQHPGVPPVHDLGVLPDGRPFLAMKLVYGQTLDALLKAEGPGGRWLGVFEGVCQAVGFAHAHGVIHRDLKPANVMVGRFGEVQVMDWGLAKELADPAGDAADDFWAGVEADDADLTRPGTVMGTPAYMAPEQAAGDVARLDRRTDVFGLGAVLCALLTGRPPYVGADAASTCRLAAEARLGDALARLDGCGAEPDLLALCRRCLTADPADRPADGGAVAAAVAALRRAADDRARQAERSEAAAAARAAEERRRRQAIAWAGGLLAAALAAGAAGVGVQWRRAERALAATEAARQAEAEQRRAADLAAAVARDREQEVLHALAFVEDQIFAAGRPTWRDGLGREVALRVAVAAAAPALDTTLADQPLLEARLRMIFGRFYWYLGEAAPAERLFRAARATYTAAHGPDHRDTLASANSLAVALGGLGRLDDAVRLDEDTYARRLAVLGPDHPDTLGSQGNLAAGYAAAGRLADARRLHLLTLDRRRATLNPGHPDIALCLYNLACVEAQAAPPGGGAQADAAMAWLRQAVAAGYRDCEQVARDADLDPLRGRLDFRWLLAKLETKARRAPVPAPPSEPAR